MDSPSRRLAEKILARLVEEKILAPDDPKKLVDKFADGKLRADDWRLAVEMAHEKAVKP